MSGEVGLVLQEKSAHSLRQLEETMSAVSSPSGQNIVLSCGFLNISTGVFWRWRCSFGIGRVACVVAYNITL